MPKLAEPSEEDPAGQRVAALADVQLHAGHPAVRLELVVLTNITPLLPDL